MKTKFAIVTGGTSGLGKAYAKYLAKCGWNLLITGRREKILFQLKSDLEQKYHIEVQICIADFNNEIQFNDLLETIKNCSHVDLLVNNAGYGSREGFFEEDYENQVNMLNVLVSAATKIVHEVVPKMLKANKGSIINVASMSAFIPAPLNYFYCSSKAFMVSFTECLHIDFLHSNIMVQALCPGFIHTEFHSKMGVENDKKGFKEKLLWMNPEAVVAYSIKSLSKSNVICIPGFVNKMVYNLMKMIPRTLSYRILNRQMPEHHHPEYCVV
ncbi:SDR family NAD(P)-dependent oxidoreductase [Plebeiibacterium sediminum]|uniref:SDR family NAD(P)-dependent oxidoreductase n=1 Tax=Plebeiibacterium sediminum TaxID=2992112 RepID=A0AAE3SEZ4_9BACT|nr:SDR family NAD(P)-dependent oxidoreductase [Plebeiobacterium sediminum]MCW3786721.1 SDR family NAD(P)-dependent oxidoreductase [Plebeiobacterium sediminum]